jgi:hypothetical protein
VNSLIGLSIKLMTDALSPPCLAHSCDGRLAIDQAHVDRRDLIRINAAPDRWSTLLMTRAFD